MTTLATLAPHTRGDTFEYSTTLLGGWTAEQFNGGLRFTVRAGPPESSVLDDVGAIASVSTDGGQIVASGTSVTVTIPASATKLWPAGKLVWDLQGVVNGSPPKVYTIAGGEISIRADVTRSP